MQGRRAAFLAEPSTGEMELGRTHCRSACRVVQVGWESSEERLVVAEAAVNGVCAAGKSAMAGPAKLDPLSVQLDDTRLGRSQEDFGLSFWLAVRAYVRCSRCSKVRGSEGAF